MTSNKVEEKSHEAMDNSNVITGKSSAYVRAVKRLEDLEKR